MLSIFRFGKTFSIFTPNHQPQILTSFLSINQQNPYILTKTTKQPFLSSFFFLFNSNPNLESTKLALLVSLSPTIRRFSQSHFLFFFHFLTLKSSTIGILAWNAKITKNTEEVSDCLLLPNLEVLLSFLEAVVLLNSSKPFPLAKKLVLWIW